MQTQLRLKGSMEEGPLSLCPDDSRDTHQDKTALFLLQSPSLSKLSAEALFSPSPAYSWHVQIQVPLSPTSPISHSLYVQKFTPPCSSVSTHTPQGTLVIGKIGVPQLQTLLCLETSKGFKQLLQKLLLENVTSNSDP